MYDSMFVNNNQHTQKFMQVEINQKTIETHSIIVFALVSHAIFWSTISSNSTKSSMHKLILSDKILFCSSLSAFSLKNIILKYIQSQCYTNILNTAQKQK